MSELGSTHPAEPLDASDFSSLQTDNSFARLGSDFYTRLPTTPLKNPRLVHANTEVAALLGLSPRATLSPEFWQL